MQQSKAQSDFNKLDYDNGLTENLVLSYNIFQEDLDIGVGGRIKIFCPKLGEKFKPTFRFKGCRTKWIQKYYELLLVPDSTDYEITVITGKFEETFKGKGVYFRPYIHWYNRYERDFSIDLFPDSRISIKSVTNSALGCNGYNILNFSAFEMKYTFYNDAGTIIYECVSEEYFKNNGLNISYSGFGLSVNVHDIFDAEPNMKLRVEVINMSATNILDTVTYIVPQNHIMNFKIIDFGR